MYLILHISCTLMSFLADRTVWMVLESLACPWNRDVSVDHRLQSWKHATVTQNQRQTISIYLYNFRHALCGLTFSCAQTEEADVSALFPLLIKSSLCELHNNLRSLIFTSDEIRGRRTTPSVGLTQCLNWNIKGMASVWTSSCTTGGFHVRKMFFGQQNLTWFSISTVVSR